MSEMPQAEERIWEHGPERPVRTIAIAAVLFLVALAVGWALTRPDPQGSGTSPNRARRALPAFALPAFDGGTITDAELARKPAVINFFASWCTFCALEMPAFERVHRRTSPETVFLGVALRDDAGAARSLARDTGVTYRLAFDNDGSLYRALRGFGMPVTVFVRSNGSIEEVHSGPLDETRLEEVLARLHGD